MTPTVSRLLVVAVVVPLTTGCGDEGKRALPLPSVFDVEGTLVVPSTAASLVPSVKGYRIDAQGLRVPLEGFAIAPSGAFSFRVDRKATATGLGLSRPESLALMGIVPPTEVFRSAAFGAADAGYFRIELFPPAEAAKATDALPLYFQTSFRVPRELALGVGRVLSLDGAVPLQAGEVGKVKVAVTSASGKPLKGASAHIIPLQGDRSVLGTALPRLPWADTGTAPVLQPLGDDGTGVLFPLPLDGEEPKYQVAAFGPGVCPGVSPQAVVKKPVAGQLTNTVSLQLPTCTAKQAAQSSVAWEATPHADENVSTENGKSVVSTNGDSVRFDVSAKSALLRGFGVKVFGGTEEVGKPAAEYQFFTFASELVVRLPLYLSGSNRDGRFLVVLESLFTEQDTRAFGKAPRAVFAGVRSSVKPLAKKEDFTVSSSAGVANVVSGRGAFTVKYGGLDCKDGLEVGVSVGTTFDAKKIPFQACDPKGNSFTFESVGALFGTRGGTRKVNFFLKNRYGNTSVHDEEGGTNSRDAYVDFGVPVIGDTDPLLNSDFGFALATAPKGTADAPFDFNAAAVRLTPANVGDHVLRFSGPADCFTDAFDEDEDGTDATGRALGRFLVPGSATGATAADWAKATACGSDLPLSSAAVTFPSVASEKASFLFQVEDLAGNVSNVVRYEIPSCASGMHSVCWEAAP